MSNDDEVIKEAEAIMTGAMSAMVDEQRREQIHSLPIITEKFLALIDIKRPETQKVHIAYIQPDNYLNLSAEIVASTPVDIEDIEKSPDAFISAKMFLFYSFDTVSEASECLQQHIAAILANELHTSDTAAYMYIRRKRYGIAVLVAAECLTVSRITKGDTITDHTPLTGEDINMDTPDKFFASCGLTKTEGELIRQLLEFHYRPQALKKQFPNAYQVTLNKIRKEIGLNTDGEED